MMIKEANKGYYRYTARLFAASMFSVMACILLHSCIHDRFDDNSTNSPQANEFVLHIGVKDPVQSSQTRAAEIGTPDENRIDDIAIWILNSATEQCTYYRYLRAEDFSEEEQAKWRNGAFSVTIKDVPPLAEGEESVFLLLANLKENMEEFPDAGVQVGRYFETEIYPSLGLKAASGANPVSAPLPMFYLNTHDGSHSHTLQFTRSVARIKANVTVDETNYPGLESKLQLDRMRIMYNYFPKQGNMYVNPDGTVSDYPGYQKEPSTVSLYSSEWADFTEAAPGGSRNTAPQYLYQRGEFAFMKGDSYDNSMPVELILHIPYEVAPGEVIEDNYYRAKILMNKDAADQYYVHPNVSYNLNIKIIGMGTDSGMETTVSCEPWNVEDKEFIAGVTLSNTAFLGYADRINDVVVTKLVHPWMASVTYTATGSPGVTIGTADIGTPGETGIRATMQDDIDEGWIDIAYASQKKRVNIRRAGHSQPVIGSEIDLGGHFVHKATEGNLPVKVSIDAASRNMKFGLGNNYTGNTPTLARMAAVMLHDGVEYIRVYVEQDGAAAPHMDNQIQRKPAGAGAKTEYGYAGTYHRYNERAERVIQMPNEAGGPWRATVVSGSDFIELSVTPSADAGVGTTAPKTGSALEGDDTYYIKDGSSTVSGEGSDIYFRIGLKSTLTSASDVRYGLVVVKYTGNAGVKKDHYIFVRQGEGEASGKFSVYNLKKPEDFTTISPDGFYRPGRAGEFVKYPTQTGYFYRWNVQTCGHPTNRIEARNFQIDQVLGNTEFNESREPCPAGYATPEYDRIKYLAGTEFGITGPYGQQLGANVLGKYADGWYDRIAEPSADARGENIAWTGMVMFDPATNESLFFPYSGVISCDTNQEGQFVLRGIRADFWCKYRKDARGPYNYNNTGIMTYEAWRMSLHSPENTPGSDDQNARFIWMTDSKTSYGTSVRCVKK